ncbi:MAG TPA: ATP-binding protein [Candidatus Didemnitutus sp.]|jgi:signal transduction histidine kinase/CheY-like chemotaxis protein
MTTPGRGPRLSFQAKVLLPVLTALVLLPCLTLYIVNSYIERQVLTEARQTLSTAETVFRKTLETRTNDLISRFESAVQEKSYRSIANNGLLQPKDKQAADTIHGFLLDQLKLYGADYDALVLTADAFSFAAVDSEIKLTSKNPHDPERANKWIAAVEPFARAVQQGDGAAAGPAVVNGNPDLVVSVPILDEHGTLVAVLSIANRIGETALLDLQTLTGADIVIADGDNISATTLRQHDLPSSILHPPVNPVSEGDRQITQLEFHNIHYTALTDSYERGNPPHGFRYVLLSSYEDRLRELHDTQTKLVAVSTAAILITGMVVWFLIRRITRPLVVLRDNAEAVGRGDFTRRVEHISSDECGDLADAFNRMTTNLQVSRTDLEKAVGTLKTTQSQLIQSEKLSAVGQFVAGIAHELNNPLTSVIGFSELLQNMDLDAKYKGHLDHIARAAIRCHKIVHSLLGFSRQKEPERNLVVLHTVVDAVLEIVAYDMRTNNVAIERNYAPELPPVLGDAHQLQQVILNILSNARQAMEGFRRDGRIVLSTGSGHGLVWLRIKDNGPGMRKEVLSRIFDPFFTTKAQGKGTGLGLSLSYGIIQEHQGSIRVESEPGDGAEFFIELPVADPTAGLTPEAAGRSLSPFKVRPPSLRVLAIDDEESILSLVQEVLRADGHRVDVASNGDTALQMIGKNRYDVIVCDWKMPGLSGIHVFEDLQTRDPAAANRMLFMTGDVVNDKFQEFLKQNGRSCLPKPFSVREFRSAVAALARPTE